MGQLGDDPLDEDRVGGLERQCRLVEREGLVDHVGPRSPEYQEQRALVAAEHQTFTDICAYQDDVPTLPNVPEIVSETIDAYAVEGCSEGDMDAGRATELTNSYVLRFLDQVLRGGPAIDPGAIPMDVNFWSRTDSP